MVSSKLVCQVLFRQLTTHQSCSTKALCLPKHWSKRFISTTSLLYQTGNPTEITKNQDCIFRSRHSFDGIPSVPFCDYIFPYLEKHGQKTFLIDGMTGKSYSFHDALLYCQKVASGLAKLGLQEGQVVGIFSANRPEYIIAWLAVSMAGGTVTELNPLYTAGEVKHQLQSTNATFLIAGLESVRAARESLSSLPQIKKAIVFGEAEGFLSFAQLMQDDGQMIKKSIPVDPNSIAHIPYSSGTTGLPKGVMVSHKGVTGSTISCTHDDVKVSLHDDVCVLLLPMFHIYGNFLMWCNAVEGCTTITLPNFVPEVLLSTIQKYKVTYLPLVPPLVLFLLQSPLVQQYDLSSLKDVMCGAAPVSTERLEELIEKFKLKTLRQGYGMSELCPIALTSRGQNPYLDSPGHPVPGVDVKIVDVKSGKSLNVGQNGEICARSHFQMLGYFDNKEATSSTIDADGWLHTGDIGYMSEKRNLYVVDRLKELIKYKGHQVAPAELEELLLSHAAVKDCGVIGIPDERAGELPRAYVVLDPKINISEEDIQNFVAGQISDEKHLRGGVIFVDQIPKSASGKILRKELKHNYISKKQ